MWYLFYAIVLICKLILEVFIALPRYLIVERKDRASWLWGSRAQAEVLYYANDEHLTAVVQRMECLFDPRAVTAPHHRHSPQVDDDEGLMSTFSHSISLDTNAARTEGSDGDRDECHTTNTSIGEPGLTTHPLQGAFTSGIALDCGEHSLPGGTTIAPRGYTTISRMCRSTMDDVTLLDGSPAPAHCGDDGEESTAMTPTPSIDESEMSDVSDEDGLGEARNKLFLSESRASRCRRTGQPMWGVWHLSHSIVRNGCARRGEVAPKEGSAADREQIVFIQHICDGGDGDHMHSRGVWGLLRRIVKSLCYLVNPSGSCADKRDAARHCKAASKGFVPPWYAVHARLQLLVANLDPLCQIAVEMLLARGQHQHHHHHHGHDDRDDDHHLTLPDGHPLPSASPQKGAMRSAVESAVDLTMGTTKSFFSRYSSSALAGEDDTEYAASQKVSWLVAVPLYILDSIEVFMQHTAIYLLGVPQEHVPLIISRGRQQCGQVLKAAHTSMYSTLRWELCSVIAYSSPKAGSPRYAPSTVLPPTGNSLTGLPHTTAALPEEMVPHHADASAVGASISPVAGASVRSASRFHGLILPGHAASTNPSRPNRDSRRANFSSSAGAQRAGMSASFSFSHRVPNTAAGSASPRRNTSLQCRRLAGVHWVNDRAPDECVRGPVVVLLLCTSIVQGGLRGHTMRRLGALCEALSAMGSLRLEEAMRCREAEGSFFTTYSDDNATLAADLNDVRYAQWYCGIASVHMRQEGRKKPTPAAPNSSTSHEVSSPNAGSRQEGRRPDREKTTASEEKYTVEQWAVPMNVYDVDNVIRALRKRLGNLALSEPTPNPTPAAAAAAAEAQAPPVKKIHVAPNLHFSTDGDAIPFDSTAISPLSSGSQCQQRRRRYGTDGMPSSQVVLDLAHPSSLPGAADSAALIENFLPASDEDDEDGAAQCSSPCWDTSSSQHSSRTSQHSSSSGQRRGNNNNYHSNNEGPEAKQRKHRLVPRRVAVVGVGWSEGAGPLLEYLLAFREKSLLDGFFCVSHTLSSNFQLLQEDTGFLPSHENPTTMAAWVRPPSIAPLMFHSQLLSRQSRGSVRLLLLITRLQLIAKGLHKERREWAKQQASRSATSPDKRRHANGKAAARAHQDDPALRRRLLPSHRFFSDSLAALHKVREEVNREMGGLGVSTQWMVAQAAQEVALNAEGANMSDRARSPLIGSLLDPTFELHTSIDTSSSAISPSPSQSQSQPQPPPQSATLKRQKTLPPITTVMDWESLLQQHQQHVQGALQSPGISVHSHSGGFFSSPNAAAISLASATADDLAGMANLNGQRAGSLNSMYRTASSPGTDLLLPQGLAATAASPISGSSNLPPRPPRPTLQQAAPGAAADESEGLPMAMTANVSYLYKMAMAQHPSLSSPMSDSFKAAEESAKTNPPGDEKDGSDGLQSGPSPLSESLEAAASAANNINEDFQCRVDTTDSQLLVCQRPSVVPTAAYGSNNKNHGVDSYSRAAMHDAAGQTTSALIELRVRSAQQVGAQLSVPTLFLHARDDDVAPVSTLPLRQLINNPKVVTVVSRRGGHSVFIEKVRDIWTNPSLIIVEEDAVDAGDNSPEDHSRDKRGPGLHESNFRSYRMRINDATWTEQLLVEFVASAVLTQGGR